MTINLNKRILLNMDTQINEWERTGDVLFYFNLSKIRQFRKDNGIRVDTLLKDLKEIDQKYYTIHENGKEYVQDAEGKPVVKEGMTKEQWRAEVDALLDEEVVVKL